MHDEPFSFIQHGRRLSTVIACLLAVGVLVFGVANGAPWWWMVPVSSAVAMLGWLVIRNPRSGMALDATRLHWFNGRRSHSLTLEQIDHVVFTTWSDGPDTVGVVLTTGEVVIVPSVCLPCKAVLVTALERRGVQLR